MIKPETEEKFNFRTSLINEAISQDKIKSQSRPVPAKLPKTSKERFEIDL